MPEFESVREVSLEAPVGLTGSGLQAKDALSGLFAAEHSWVGSSGSPRTCAEPMDLSAMPTAIGPRMAAAAIRSAEAARLTVNSLDGTFALLVGHVLVGRTVPVIRCTRRT
ncbi:MAG: hypothetical protein QOH57_2871 [Mycobacterium sp.]|jgi:hypothetical protein|nr:hypothetical protein [Mycobacterium sp.]